MNSWDKIDSRFNPEGRYELGNNDEDLCTRLAKGGSVHAKYKRMIKIYCDVTAPLYWWKEFDTYKVGTVANSCSTMHRLGYSELTLDDLSVEHLNDKNLRVIKEVLISFNKAREIWIESGKNDKDAWWQMIQLLPSCYNQKRTIEMNYQVMTEIYEYRSNHKLDEWHEFCETMRKGLPYFKEIILSSINTKKEED